MRERKTGQGGEKKKGENRRGKKLEERCATNYQSVPSHSVFCDHFIARFTPGFTDREDYLDIISMSLETQRWGCGGRRATALGTFGCTDVKQGICCPGLVWARVGAPALSFTWHISQGNSGRHHYKTRKTKPGGISQYPSVSSHQ